MSVPSPLLTHLRVCRCSYSRPATLTRSLRCAAAPNSQTARAPLAPPHANPRIGSPPRAPQYLTCGNVSAPVGLEPAYNSCRLRTPGLPRRCACTRRPRPAPGLSRTFVLVLVFVGRFVLQLFGRHTDPLIGVCVCGGASERAWSRCRCRCGCVWYGFTC